MSELNHKIDFVAFISVCNANPNGDPNGGNRPRVDYNNLGEMSPDCLKRKIRNRMQDTGYPVFVQNPDHRCYDEYSSLYDRASTTLKGIKDEAEYNAKACKTWLDVRSFGQVFAFKSNAGSSTHVRGPVSIHLAISQDPVVTTSMKITKCVNGDPSETRSSDTMGDRHFVRFGLYKLKGSINVQLAEKTGFTEEDALVIKECLRTLFVNDASSARPEGSMEVVKLYWFDHNCKDGQFSSAKVHRSVQASLKDGVSLPASAEDYVITLEPLDGLTPEIIDGI